ncbi:MAG: plasmid stabilization protein [Sphingomonas sp.]|nr:plasmid stabilization protein [Sphingomonas sp.]
MSGFRVQRAAGYRLDEIYVYTRDRWGEEQADRYINGLFARFASIAARDVPWRAIPAEFEASGFVCRYEHHFIYWRVLTDGAVGIVTILHERMHQIDRLKDDMS